MDDREKLLNKNVAIMVTNSCNLSCKNCTSLCDRLPDDKVHHISLEELENNVETLAIARSLYGKKLPRPPIAIYGGEPTTHPQFEEMIDLLGTKFKDIQFLVFSNGISSKLTMIRKYDNFHKPRIHVKTSKYIKSQYRKILIAPIDEYKNPDKQYYWDLAKKNCTHWEQCRSCILGNKAYVCDFAAVLDRLLLRESIGWEVEGEPFDKTTEEISQQMQKCCYRCGLCFDEETKVKLILDDRQYSDANTDIIELTE